LRLNNDTSDLVGQFKIEFSNLSLTHQFNIDPDDGTIRRNELYPAGEVSAVRWSI
jgi:hypothetical protein